MLLIKTKIHESKIHGIGLFADEFIPKGTEVWRFTPGFDQKFTREQILNFPEILQIYIYKYCWRSKTSKLYCFAADDGKYFNHTKNPNTVSEYRASTDEVVTVASTNIQIGDEITSDYSDFDNDVDSDNVLSEIAVKYKLDVWLD